MNDNQILVYIAEECTILWAKFGVITVFHCSVIMHCCQKLVSDLGTIFQLCTNKIPIQFALYEMNTKT